jgi:hypothetical protein
MEGRAATRAGAGFQIEEEIWASKGVTFTSIGLDGLVWRPWAAQLPSGFSWVAVHSPPPPGAGSRESSELPRH